MESSGAGLAVVLGLVILGICFAKGKPGMAVLGLFLPGVAIVGAIRIAKPGSWWARNNYPKGSVKEQLSRHRFPEAIIKQTNEPDLLDVKRGLGH